MDHVALVDSEVEAGRKLLDALDESGFSTAAAMWMYFADHSEWRVVLALADGISNLKSEYMKVARVLNLHPDIKSRIDLSRIKIVSTKDSMISGLLGLVRVTDGGTIRFSTSVVNGVFVEDALIYRMAA